MMSNNIISLTNILSLINTPDVNGDKPDYLVFIPNVNRGNVFYSNKSFKRVDIGDVELFREINANPIFTKMIFCSSLIPNEF